MCFLTTMCKLFYKKKDTFTHKNTFTPTIRKQRQPDFKPQRNVLIRKPVSEADRGSDK